MFSQGGTKPCNLPPCGERKRRRAPAPRSGRNDFGDRGMEANKRCKRLLHDPGKLRLRIVPARLRQGRHVMDDVAQRGGLDEENV